MISEVAFTPQIINPGSQVYMALGFLWFKSCEITKVNNFCKSVIALERVTSEEEGLRLIGLINVIVFTPDFISLSV
jgi:hypothetical protein